MTTEDITRRGKYEQKGEAAVVREFWVASLAGLGKRICGEAMVQLVASWGFVCGEKCADCYSRGFDECELLKEHILPSDMIAMRRYAEPPLRILNIE